MKNRTSFLVSIFMLVLMAAVAGIGFLMKWTLPPGSAPLQILGMTRHEWGTVHLWISIALLLLLILHILLAWPQLACRFRLWIRSARARWVMGLGLIGLLIGLVSWPFVLKPDAREKGSVESFHENGGRQYRGGR